MVPTDEKVELPEDIFRQLREILHEQSGIFFDENSRYYFESRLQHSVRRLNFDNFRDYYLFLKYDSRREAEMANFVDLLTVHETYFFRENNQLEALASEILPQIYEQRKADRSFQIWCAGCSSGEEAYTVAMLVLERPEFKDWTINILANDISQRVLQIARQGVYPASALRQTDPYFQARYFRPEGDKFRITDEVRQRVTFLCLNLFDHDRLSLIGPVDAILCRNVIIYFDLAEKRQIITTLHSKLRPGGYLLLGHSESLMSLSTAFELKHLKKEMVYQKPMSLPSEVHR